MAGWLPIHLGDAIEYIKDALPVVSMSADNVVVDIDEDMLPVDPRLRVFIRRVYEDVANEIDIEQIMGQSISAILGTSTVTANSVDNVFERSISSFMQEYSVWMMSEAMDKIYSGEFPDDVKVYVYGTIGR